MDADSKKVSVPSANSRRSINAILRKTWQADDSQPDGDSNIVGEPGSGTDGVAVLKKLKIGGLGGRRNRARSASMNRQQASAQELPTVIDNDADLPLTDKSVSSTAPAAYNDKDVSFGMTPISKLQPAASMTRSAKKKSKTIAGMEPDTAAATAASKDNVNGKTHKVTIGTRFPPVDRDREDSAALSSSKRVKKDIMKSKDKKGMVIVEGEEPKVREKEKYESDDERVHSAAKNRADKKPKRQSGVMFMSTCASMEQSSARRSFLFDGDDEQHLAETGLGTAAVVSVSAQSPEAAPTAGVATASTVTTAAVITATTASAAGADNTTTLASTSTLNGDTSSAAGGTILGSKSFKPSGAMTVMLQLTPAIDDDPSSSSDKLTTACKSTQECNHCNCGQASHESRKSPMALTPAFGGASQDEIKKALALRRAKTIKAESVFETTAS